MTVKNSSAWPLFEHMTLKEPKRDASDPMYSAFVDRVGAGTLPAHPLFAAEPDVPVVCLAGVACTDSIATGASRVFSNAQDMGDHDRAVLCMHNYAVTR